MSVDGACFYFPCLGVKELPDWPFAANEDLQCRINAIDGGVDCNRLTALEAVSFPRKVHAAGREDGPPEDICQVPRVIHLIPVFTLQRRHLRDEETADERQRETGCLRTVPGVCGLAVVVCVCVWGGGDVGARLDRARPETRACLTSRIGATDTSHSHPGTAI